MVGGILFPFSKLRNFYHFINQLVRKVENFFRHFTTVPSYRSKETQVECLRHILHSLNTRKKIISVHSRRAEKELFALLKEYNIKNVVFHWYSGPIDLIPDIIGEGYYFSINEAMTLSSNGKRIIAAIPRDRVLTETDAPFNEKCSIENVMHYMNLVEGDIKTNFNKLLANLRN